MTMSESEHPLVLPQPPLGSFTGKKLLGITLAVAASALSIAFSATFHKKPPPPTASAPGMHVGRDHIELEPNAPQWSSIHVGLVKPAAPHWTDPVPARVQVNEEHAARVGSPLAGRVIAVQVALGQVVKKNQPLFSVASPDIASLRADREKAAVDVETAKAALARVKSMVDARVLPGKDAIEADTQFREATVSLRSAEGKLGALKVSGGGNEFTVIAPRDGIVVEKNVLPSQEVSSEGVLITVADLSDVWIIADLFEADAANVRTGAQARISSPSLPGFSADATVDMVSSVADPERHTVPLRVRLPNPTGELKLNMFAEIQFRVDSTAGATDVPASALVSDGNRQYVYVQDATGRMARRSVVAGTTRQGEVTIVRGLAAGEKVIEEGAILLDNQIEISN